MHRILRATVLMLALVTPTLAGEMGAPIAPPADGQQSQATTVTTYQGDIGLPTAGSEITRIVLHALLALF